MTERRVMTPDDRLALTLDLQERKIAILSVHLREVDPQTYHKARKEIREMEAECFATRGAGPRMNIQSLRELAS